jgi:hypothetical protein
MVDPVREDRARQDEPSAGQRKPYRPPRLVVHGRIEEITAAGGATGSDGLAGSSLV